MSVAGRHVGWAVLQAFPATAAQDGGGTDALGSVPDMQVGVVVVDGMLDLGLGAVLDVLASADRLAPEADVPGPVFDVVRYGPGTPVRTGQGLVVDNVTVDEVRERPPDVLLLPALGLCSGDEVVERVRASGLVDLVADAAARGVHLAAACTGAFFLAEAGALDGRAATTSWWLGPTFRARYPAVRLEESRALVVDGPVTTAGAAFAHVDLALSLVQRRSPSLAERVSRYLVVGDRPSQASVASASVLASADPVLSAFERHVREHLAHPVPVAEAARAVGTTERTLQRLTASVLGLTPVRFVQQVRLEHAAFLLRTSDASLQRVAEQVGYRNAATLRALLRRASRDDARAPVLAEG